MTRAHFILVAICVSLLSACLRPMRERAERDLEVGSAESAAAELVVDDGLATVYELTDDRITLWANAPVLEATLSVALDTTFTLEVRNTVPDAELQVEGAGDVLAAELIAEPLPTRKIWRFAAAAGSVLRCVIGSPAAATKKPFSFGVLSDVQEALFKVGDIYRRMNQDPTLHFILGAGDLTERGTREELREFQERLEELRIPYYATLGNHELGTTPLLWHEFFGRASQHFVYRHVHYSLIDSASASVDPLVYGWLDGWLTQARDSVHIVAMHIPPVDPTGIRNGSFGSRNEAAKLLYRLGAGNVDLTLYGHVHSYYRFDNAGIEAHISGGGGAVPERFDGIGRHYLVVSVDPNDGILGTKVVRVD